MIKKKQTQKKKTPNTVKRRDPKDVIQDIILGVVKSGNSVGKCRKGEIDRTSLYLIGLLHGKTKKKAALDAGFSFASAENTAHAIESTEHFKVLKESMSAELVKKGITIESMAGVLSEMMKRRSTTFYNGREIEGKHIDSFSAKMALDTISKLLGLNAPEKKIIAVADLRDVKDLTDEEAQERLRLVIQKQ